MRQTPGDEARMDMRLILMGVSGSGKTTLGQALAARTGWPFLDGDDFHAPQARAKMAAGLGLSDDDREPWLRRICQRELVETKGYASERQARDTLIDSAATREGIHTRAHSKRAR